MNPELISVLLMAPTGVIKVLAVRSLAFAVFNDTAGW